VRPLDPRLLRQAPLVRVLLAVAAGLATVDALLLLAQGRLLAEIVGGARPGGLDRLGGLLGPLLVVLLIRAVVPWGLETTSQRLSGAVKSGLRSRLLAHGLELGPDWLAGVRTGELTTLVVDGLDALDPYLGRYVPALAFTAIVPLLVVASLLVVDPLSALIVAATLPLIPIFSILVGWAAEGRRRRRWRALARLAYAFTDLLAGLPTLKVHGRARDQVRAIAEAASAHRRETMAALRIAFLSALVVEMAATLSVALVAVSIGLRLVEGGLDLASGLFVLVVAPEAYLPLRQLGALFHASEPGRAAAEQALAILEAEPVGSISTGPEADRDPVPRWWLGGAISLDAVTVERSDRGISAPWRVSATIRPGRVLALIGPSGAGKSTLLAVLLGFRRPTAGRILLSAPGERTVSLEEVPPAAWRSEVAWLPQHPWLAPGTVAENVRLGRPEASDAEVNMVLAAVGLDGVPPTTVLGEAGRGLSSGQRRRVALARTLLRGGRLLLLDEPTAGLDPDSERAVLAAIRDAAQAGLAVVLATHRPDTIAIADEVVLVDSGPLAAEAAEAVSTPSSPPTPPAPSTRPSPPTPPAPSTRPAPSTPPSPSTADGRSGHGG
jgi:ATP-binding cassette subfamily C protein CydCD